MRGGKGAATDTTHQAWLVLMGEKRSQGSLEKYGKIPHRQRIRRHHNVPRERRHLVVFFLLKLGYPIDGDCVAYTEDLDVAVHHEHLIEQIKLRAFHDQCHQGGM